MLNIGRNEWCYIVSMCVGHNKIICKPSTAIKSAQSTHPSEQVEREKQSVLPTFVTYLLLPMFRFTRGRDRLVLIWCKSPKKSVPNIWKLKPKTKNKVFVNYLATPSEPSVSLGVGSYIICTTEIKDYQRQMKELPKSCGKSPKWNVTEILRSLPKHEVSSAMLQNWPELG